MKILKSVQKVPGGMMVVPLLIGVVINTIAPDVLKAGGYVTALWSSAGTNSLIGAFLFCLLRDGAADPGALSADTLAGYLEFSNAYAAYTTTREGALAAMADAKQMEEWLVFCKNM